MKTVEMGEKKKRSLRAINYLTKKNRRIFEQSFNQHVHNTRPKQNFESLFSSYTMT